MIHQIQPQYKPYIPPRENIFARMLPMMVQAYYTNKLQDKSYKERADTEQKMYKEREDAKNKVWKERHPSLDNVKLQDVGADMPGSKWFRYGNDIKILNPAKASEFQKTLNTAKQMGWTKDQTNKVLGAYIAPPKTGGTNDKGKWLQNAQGKWQYAKPGETVPGYVKPTTPKTATPDEYKKNQVMDDWRSDYNKRLDLLKNDPTYFELGAYGASVAIPAKYQEYKAKEKQLTQEYEAGQRAILQGQIPPRMTGIKASQDTKSRYVGDFIKNLTSGY